MIILLYIYVCVCHPYIIILHTCSSSSTLHVPTSWPCRSVAFPKHSLSCVPGPLWTRLASCVFEFYCFSMVFPWFVDGFSLVFNGFLLFLFMFSQEKCYLFLSVCSTSSPQPGLRHDLGGWWRWQWTELPKMSICPSSHWLGDAPPVEWWHVVMDWEWFFAMISSSSLFLFGAEPSASTSCTAWMCLDVLWGNQAALSCCVQEWGVAQLAIFIGKIWENDGKWRWTNDASGWGLFSNLPGELPP